MIEIHDAFGDQPDDFDAPAGDGVTLHPTDMHPAAAVHPVHDPHDNLWIAEGDRVWDLGPAETDTDADGIADSLTRIGPDGMAIYTDSDHDGQVDAITEVDSDGGYETRLLDTSTGEWVRTDIGRLE